MPLADLGPIPMQTRSDDIAQRLRDAISQGNLQPGQRLVETELAAQLGVSRVPIREAIQKLTEEGLVKRIPRYGAFVALPSRQEIEEIASIRSVLEQFVVERVMERWKPEYAVQLRGIIDGMVEAASRQDLQQMNVQDLLFHQTLWMMADHTILLEMVSGLRSRINYFLYETSRALTPEELDYHASSHGKLIAVLSGNDVAKAKAEMIDHIQVATQRILTGIAKHAAQYPFP